VDEKTQKLRDDAIQRELLSDHNSIQDDEDEYMNIINKKMLRSCYLFCNKKYRNRKKAFN
jgi:hypothetical protein